MSSTDRSPPKRITRIRDGDPVPEGGRHIYSERIPDEERAYDKWGYRDHWAEDVLDVLTLGMTSRKRQCFRIVPDTLFHYYEVDAQPAEAAFLKGTGGELGRIEILAVECRRCGCMADIGEPCRGCGDEPGSQEIGSAKS